METSPLFFYTRQSQADFWRAPIAGGRVCAGFSASLELRTSRGQDFVLVRAHEERLVFAVCDGVSQSFLGDLAAHFLGFRLGDYLWRDPGRTTTERTALANMKAFLDGLRPEASLLVEKAEFGPQVQGMLRETLLSLKKYGTETVFAAGLVDLRKRRLSVWQLGNVALLGGAAADLALLGETPDDSNRWSSARGVRGRLRFHYLPLPERFLTCTDGAAPIVEALWRGPTSAEAFAELAAEAHGAAEDDLAFFLLDATE